MGDLRNAFAAPNLPFTIASSGMGLTLPGSGGRRDELCEAQRRATLRAPFVGSTLFVETRDYARSIGSSPNPNQARSVYEPYLLLLTTCLLVLTCPGFN